MKLTNIIEPTRLRFVKRAENRIIMKIFRFLAPLLLLAATAFGQVSMTQAPGTYTDTSIPVRSGTYNKFVDAPSLRFDSGTGTLFSTIFSGSASGLTGITVPFNPTAVKTSAYNAAANDLVPVDTTSGAVTITLPTAPADKTVIAVKHVIQGGTNAVTIAAGGSDVFNKAGGGTTLTINLVNGGYALQYKASGAIWYAISDDLPRGSLLAFANSWGGQQTFVAPILGTPASVTLTNATGLPIGGISATGTPSSSTFLRGDGSWNTPAGGGNVSNTGTPTSGQIASWTSATVIQGNTTGTGILTALGVNVGTAGAPVVNGGVLGTPSSGTVTNLTGTASININGTVGAGTPTTVAATTGVFGSTTSLLLGTAGSAVGNIGFRNATSGTATLAPPTGALSTYNVTLPNAASTLPIFGQQITFAGPTAARTVTLLDAAYTTARQDAAQTFTGVQSFTSPDFTTSVTTPTVSFTAWAGATTLLTFGGTGASASTFLPSTLDATSSTTGALRTSGGISAAKALNIGTTGTFGGAITDTAATPQLILGANTTTKGGIKMFGNTSGDVTISPLAVAGTATALTVPAVSGGLIASATAIGTVTGTPSSSNFLRGDNTWAVPSGTISGLTTSAIVTAASASTIQTASATATMDSSGNISTPGSITVGNAATTAGAIVLTQGTTQSVGTTNITIQAPAAVTSFTDTLESAVGSTGVRIGTVSGTNVTESRIAPSTSGNVLTSNGTTWTSAAAAGGTAANPTGTVGLTAVNGSLSTYLRSDGAPPLSQAITPTWTGLHIFSTGLTSTAGTNSIAALVDAVDGTTPLNKIYQTVASGTAYTLTATSAAVTFGTTSPTITLANAGTYWISCDVQFNYVGATFAANRQFDLKLRRTNNTAADVTGSLFSEFVPVLTTITDAGPHSHIGPFLYTTAGTTDSLTVFADISVLPTAGTVTVTACTIVAMRAF